MNADAELAPVDPEQERLASIVELLEALGYEDTAARTLAPLTDMWDTLLNEVRRLSQMGRNCERGEPNKRDIEDCEACALQPDNLCRYHQGREDARDLARAVFEHMGW